MMARAADTAVMRSLTDFAAGKRLLQAEDGSLHVRDSAGALRAVDPASPIELLPLLERTRDQYADGVVESVPLKALLVMALDRESDYWPMLAVVGWVTDADLADWDVHRAVSELASGRLRSQALQHQARPTHHRHECKRYESGTGFESGRRLRHQDAPHAHLNTSVRRHPLGGRSRSLRRYRRRRCT